jgi:hypothetical protein
MLKFINFQIDNEETQNSLERAIAPSIQQRLKSNLQAIRHFQPHLLPLIEQHQLLENTIFCTASGQLNIVNVATGRVLYQREPLQEVAAEVNSFLQHAPCISLISVDTATTYQPLPVKVDAVMMFGLGLGHQLAELLQMAKIRFLVIYEPNIEHLLCSLHCADWEQILELAAAMGTMLSLQIGNDSSSVPEDIQELLSIDASLDKIYLYRHLCDSVTDEVFQFLQDNSGKPAELCKKGRQFLGYDLLNDYVPPRPKNVLGNVIARPFTDDKLFQRNMQEFARLYPQLHQVLADFTPQNWQITQDQDGLVNLWHSKRQVYLYTDLDSDSATMLKHYLQEPYKDDVMVGQAASEKFSSFVHYKYIAKLQQMFLALKTEQHPLPEQVDSLIVFGLALGKHVEMLFGQREITNLYICEPNLDFFYASLFIMDWQAILVKAEAENRRIYLNVGGDGSEYFSDFMGQFYQVGAYAIANTYILPSYYTPALNKAIQNLRKQFKVVLAMGEYYDHARYGLAHTYLSLESGNKFLKQSVPDEQKRLIKSLPVFIVGNGPSLDNSIEYIRKYRHQVVVVSCGTAIRSLYKQGIQPDFHAEIEQNRATYDWINQVNDPVFLKGIKLLSVNGIHPDTANLFQATYLAFKDGEASTQIFRKHLERNNYSVASLSFAYPTVSNLALNYIIKMGFEIVYLFGVDLGYTDIMQHHSKFSAYYTADGKEVYDYKAFHGSGVPVKGNFRGFVYTKPEFDVSKRLIEQVIASSKGQFDIYNCSDGVFIDGAKPLHAENILIPASTDSAKPILDNYLQHAYYSTSLREYAKSTLAFYDLAALKSSIEAWCDIIPSEITTREQAVDSINSQWHFLRARAAEEHNLIFYLFYGSSNYFLSVLTKVLPRSDSHTDDLDRFNIVLKHWRNYLMDALQDFIEQPIKSDTVKVNYLPTPTT